MRRRSVSALVLLAALVIGALATGSAVRAASPRVVIVVGPVGALTDSYRAIADEGARAARRYTSDVETIYSPNATWPAVRQALQGASIVVYLGHGNGWPSRYTDTLNPQTQDGLGLNPVAGVDDVAHQYFGEAYLARQVRLAPNAVVLLHRLCYASGNSEPGLPEGTLGMAEQRADNYAAGWLKAGAGAVVADAFQSPAYYIAALMTRAGSVEQIWRHAPSFHNHVISFTSQRTPSAVAMLDPTLASSGFYRSFVGRPGLNSTTVSRPSITPPPAAAVLPARSGPAVQNLALVGRPVASTTVTVSFQVVPGKATADTAALGLGTRWDPLVLAGQTSPTTGQPESPVPYASSSPALSAAPAASAVPSVSPAPGGTLTPGWQLEQSTNIAPEEPGTLIAATQMQASPGGFSATVAVPEQPGLYRLVLTLLDATGTAYDADTQTMMPALIVRVTAPVSAMVLAPDHVGVVARDPLAIGVEVTNTGSVAWQGNGAVATGPGASIPPAAGPSDAAAPTGVTLIGRWVSLDVANDGQAIGSASADLPALQPGASQMVILATKAPSRPGSYLLFLDVVDPVAGSLTWAGGDPSVVRVTVVGPGGHVN